VKVASSLVIVCAVVGTARAQSNEALAIKAFDEGRAHLKAGKYAEACAAFERSQKLDPANGTLYNLAGCYVKLGKLATAWGAYRTLSETDTNDQRRKDSRAQASALAPRLPKLVVTVVGGPPADLLVRLDDLDYTPLLAVDNPIDLGAHTLTASAPGHAPWTQDLQITTEGKTTTVEITLVKQEPPGDAVKPMDPPPDVSVPPADPIVPGDPSPPAGGASPIDRGPPFSPTLGLVVGGVGVAALATGVVFGLVARGRYQDAQFLCGAEDQLCRAADVDAANAFADSARSAATISTVSVIGGAVLVGAGTGMFLYARSREAAVQVTPGGGGSAVGLTLGGSF
jgi:tetratricopeptide (TPR) repeat protein